MELERLYADYTNTELYQVLRDRKGYTKEAISAARKELDSRNLSELEKSDAIKNYNQIKSKNKGILKNSQKQYINELIEKGAGKLNNSQPVSTDKLINRITIILLILATLEFITLYDYIFYIIDRPNKIFRMEFIQYMLPFYLLAQGALLFWNKKKSGWIFVNSYFVYGIYISLLLISQYLIYQPSEFGFDEIFPGPTINSRIITPLITIAVVLFGIKTLSSPELKEVFNIDNTTRYLTYSLALLSAYLIF